MRAKQVFHLCLLGLLFGDPAMLAAQEKPMSAAEIKSAAGDEDATDAVIARLSADLKPANMQAAMRKGTDW